MKLLINRFCGGRTIAWDSILLGILSAAQHEIMLFAAVGVALGGIDDLIVDMLFFVRHGWRRLTVYTRHRPMNATRIPLPAVPGGLAVFIPAWQEADVIGPMLRTSLRRWGKGDYCIFVGVYPNDPATSAAVSDASQDPRIITAVTRTDGPTTKADCLNALWREMLEQESHRGQQFKAIVLHDAEDVVHHDSLRVLDRLTDRFDLVQLPVLPLVSQQSQWIAGHYCDEFAESHGKYLTVREAIGAAVPSAGVGCAFSRKALAKLAKAQDGLPFDPASLTEDYEIGLRIAENGGRGIFVRMLDNRRKPVCTREHFPETLSAAIHQKARWMIGISLSGWDRLGWKGGIAELWMRLRDRRSALAALILFAAYLAFILWIFLTAAGWLGLYSARPVSPLLVDLLWFNGVLMAWRVAMRALFVIRFYGVEQGLRSIPRTIFANFIAILAAARAVRIYIGMLRGQPLVWDKTQHRFPADRLGYY
ncbi:glycosyl transferase family protein [Sphingobium phenoxybenzoativorans]|uniref:Glycosyl transferase family protein n=1 Tax=Sphingobium phenoxybenzoativorans TaxID=1592790 RepID=A0A975Q1F4_9SPHN|nr:glycosyl transferase family protein [Sphingobium phenoxybenzoativorans]